MVKIKKPKTTCNVANQHCLAPADGFVSTRSKCFACGMPVCMNCSLIIPYKFINVSKKRICHNCIIQNDGSDYRVLEHIYIQSGYSKETFPEYWNSHN